MEPTPAFEIGQRVNRVEDREVTGAVVLSVEQLGDEFVYMIRYDEGGEGSWPESSLVAEE